jgi:ABC-type protease/lipase transport system fused ATPase/permease subunit
LAIASNWGTIEETRGAYARREELLAGADDGQRIAPNELVGELSCENLGFLAENGRPILQGIGCRVPPGSVLGVIGPSGAGKSTLLQLLAGAGETKLGTVKIDGFPLAQWPHDVIGRNRGYLPQSVDLLPGTIWENVARFEPYSEESNAKVVAAMEAIDALPIAQAKPGGLNFQLGEDGMPLSGGQKQRIGLARAFYGDPKLIVLDEPNSALDAEGEAALSRAIVELRRKGSTVVFSTHKASMLELCDFLLVVMNGYMHSFSGRDDILDRIQASGNKLIEAENEA